MDERLWRPAGLGVGPGWGPRRTARPGGVLLTAPRSPCEGPAGDRGLPGDSVEMGEPEGTWATETVPPSGEPRLLTASFLRRHVRHGVAPGVIVWLPQRHGTNRIWK